MTKSNVAVVLVHGIGEQLRGATLVEWVEPLFKRMDFLLTKAGSRSVKLQSVRLDSEDATHARLTIEGDSVDPRSIEFIEARWSESFLVQPPKSVFQWAFRFATTAAVRLGRHLRRFLRPSWKYLSELNFRTMDDVVEEEMQSPWAMVGGAWIYNFLFTVILPLFLAALAVISLAATSFVLVVAPPILGVATGAVLLILAVLVRVPILGRWLRPIATVVITFFGDASAWNTSPVNNAAMRDLVRSRIRRANELGDEVVVIAHSQGAAIACRAILDNQPIDDLKVDLLVTVGGAVSLLHGPTQSDAGAVSMYRPVDAWAAKSSMKWINIWATWDPVPAGPVVDDATELHTRWDEMTTADARVKEELEDRISRVERLPDETDDGLRARALELTSSTFDQRQWLADQPGPAGPEEWAVHNRGSLITDHVTYTENTLEVIDPLARILIGGADTHSTDETDQNTESAMERHIHLVRYLTFNRALALIVAVLLAPITLTGMLTSQGLKDAWLTAIELGGWDGVIDEFFAGTFWLPLLGMIGIGAVIFLVLSTIATALWSNATNSAAWEMSRARQGWSLFAFGAWQTVLGFVAIFMILFTIVSATGALDSDAVVQSESASGDDATGYFIIFILGIGIQLLPLIGSSARFAPLRRIRVAAEAVPTGTEGTRRGRGD